MPIDPFLARLLKKLPYFLGIFLRGRLGWGREVTSVLKILANLNSDKEYYRQLFFELRNLRRFTKADG